MNTYLIKLYSSTGKFIGKTEESDLDDALELVKGHITDNDTIAVIAVKEYLEDKELI